MDRKTANFRRRTLRPSYINSILMVALVLFLLGITGILVLNAQIAAKSIKENLRVSVYLKDKINEVEIMQLRKKIEAEPFVKTTEYISKDEAVTQFMKRADEDIREILGDVNPLPASFEIGLHSNYVNADSVKAVKNRLESYREVKFVKTRQILVGRLDDQFKQLGIVLAVLSAVFFLIVVTLIDKSIRLAMYANRFLIRSMQLVGATKWFIISPYIRRGMINGLISGIIAILLLVGILVLMQREFPSLSILQESYKFALLFAGILLIGILISWWSTQHAVSKYLKMRLDELY